MQPPPAGVRPLPGAVRASASRASQSNREAGGNAEQNRNEDLRGADLRLIADQVKRDPQDDCQQEDGDKGWTNAHAHVNSIGPSS